LKKLYVGNLPYQASESDLQGLFTQSGVNVEGVSLMRDRFSGEPRGFGFVEVADSDLDRAVDGLNGQNLMGRKLVVNEARPMREGAGGGGGGERRGSAGRGRRDY